MTEVRNIQSYNLPIDLKVAVVGNHSKLTINNCIIKGNHNKINGDYNIILGNHNKIKGQNNICKGNHNKNITI
ncbi:MAG: hypothetical protein GY775_16705 [Candidatus Scalindua sp.]|nr:hypothetical protein [Candidatus Scalindua sp.]